MENANTLPKVSVYPLLGIGIVSGLFAAMFGIGGGVVIVPLLMLLTKIVFFLFLFMCLFILGHQQHYHARHNENHAK